MFLDKILFFLLLLLPTQLGRHFWPKETLIYGAKIDFLSPTIYLQDLLIVVVIALCLFKNRKTLFLKDKKFVLLFFLFYLLFALVNIGFSLSPLIAFFSWLRLTEMLFFGLFVYQNSKKVLNLLLLALPFIVIFESFLGLLQTFYQSSVGGLFWFFGERTFNIFSPAIARASWLGQVFLRPYGTFSHPNSFAGFFLISLILLLGKKKLSLFDKISVFLGLILIFLTFSRTVWLSACIIGTIFVIGKILLFLTNRDKNKNNIFDFPYLYTLIVLPVVGFIFSRTSIDPLSISNRLQLTKIALSIVKESPLLGVGANNFIIALSTVDFNWSWIYWLQPVHNIFLLIASEFGLTGLFVFLVFIFLMLKRFFQFQISSSGRNPFENFSLCFLMALLAIFLTGMFDHYWLTLIQNQLLFVLVMALSWSFFGDTIVSNGKR